MIRVTVIGSGGVAESLALAVSRSAELSLEQVFGRNAERVAHISQRCGVSPSDEFRDADVYILSVSDRAIAEVCSSLVFPDEALVVHTAGSVGEEVISHPRRGVLYPLQTFTVGCEVDMSDVPIFIEGCELVREVAESLSSRVVEMDSKGRQQLHLCAVFACNFVNSMYATSATLAQRANIPFEYLKPLIAESCRKALSVADPRTVQTGPARRGDVEVQQRHLSMLNDENLENIYKILSLQIWETSKKM